MRWKTDKKRMTVKELAEYYEVPYGKMRRILKRLEVSMSDPVSIAAFIEHVTKHPQVLEKQ